MSSVRTLVGFAVVNAIAQGGICAAMSMPQMNAWNEDVMVARKHWDMDWSRIARQTSFGKKVTKVASYETPYPEWPVLRSAVIVPTVSVDQNPVIRGDVTRVWPLALRTKDQAVRDFASAWEQSRPDVPVSNWEIRSEPLPC